jgi:hypothetical protein
MYAALEANQRARGAGVENGDAHVGAHGIDPLAQLTIAHALATQEQPSSSECPE